MEYLRSTTLRGDFTRVLLIVACTSLMALTGCGNDSGVGDDETRDTGDVGGVDGSDAGAEVSNAAPEARANVEEGGPFATGTRIAVDASESSDPDGDNLSFTWSFASAPQGVEPTFDAPSMAQTSFVAEAAGSYELSVEVSDGIDSDTATVSVTVLAEPTADAGDDRSGEVGQAITFDGSDSSSPGDAPIEFLWSFVRRPQGSSVSFDDAEAQAASFTPDEPGIYVAQLEVSNAATSTVDRVNAEVAPADGRLGSQVYAAPSGDDQNPGTAERPVQTFGAALQIKRDYNSVSRIQLAEGSYDLGADSVTISEDLDVVGPSGDDATAEFTATGDVFAVESDAFLTLVDVDITTDGVAFSPEDDASVSLIGVTCEAVICATTGSLLGDEGGSIQVVDATLQAASDSATALASTRGDGVSVTDTTIRGFESRGVAVSSDSLTIRNATFENNARAVQISQNGADEPTLIRDTEMTGNDEALVGSSVRAVTLDDVTISGTTGDAVSIDAGALVLRGSTIEDGDADGVSVQGNIVLTVRNSNISGFTGAGLRVRGDGARIDLGDEGVEANNSIFDNDGAQLLDARVANAEGNITLNGTGLSGGTAVMEPPAGTYSGPGFDDHGIVIENE
ncbi:MAG: PKD domain-containing protein, partial [Myxococcota bacterium]